MNSSEYVTRHGNKCKKISRNIGNEVISAAINAKNIGSFIEEIREGKEISENSTLKLKTKNTHIRMHGRGIDAGFNIFSIDIYGIAQEEGEEFSRLNCGAVQGVHLVYVYDDSLDGINLLLRDQSLKKLTTFAYSKHIWRVISWGKHIEDIMISSLKFANDSSTLHHMNNLKYLKAITVDHVIVESKRLEMNFFKALETLPNIKDLDYKHSVGGSDFTQIRFNLTLPPDFKCRSLGRLLNMWNTTNKVGCVIQLVGKFTKVFCRYILSQFFAQIEELDQLILGWIFFKEDEMLISRPQMRKHVAILHVDSRSSFRPAVPSNPRKSVLVSSPLSRAPLLPPSVVPKNIQPPNKPMPRQKPVVEVKKPLRQKDILIKLPPLPPPTVNSISRHNEIPEPSFNGNDFFSHVNE